MSLQMFLFYTLVRLKSIVVFMISIYGILNLTSDQLCLEKVPSLMSHSQNIDLFDQLTLHFENEPYISPHIYALIYKGGERYNSGGYPANCEIRHSLPSINGKNRTSEYGSSFNNVLVRKKGKETFQYNYTISVSNKIIIKNFTRALRVLYDLDDNGMFKISLISASFESCSLEARVVSNQLICKRSDNMDRIFFVIMVMALSIYSFLCFWTRFSKGLSRRVMFKLHSLFSETKGFEFCNEYTKSWTDFNNETYYTERSIDDLNGEGMDSAFIGGKFYRIFRNEAFISSGTDTEKVDLNLTDGQYENLKKYIRTLNVSTKNCFVEGTHFLTLKQVLGKYNKSPNFYVGPKENLTDRIMDPEFGIGVIDSLNFNLLFRSCQDCCPKSLYKLYYHFLKFQCNDQCPIKRPVVMSKNCGFLSLILKGGKTYSLSPFERPDYFKNSQWKYYISDLWKLLKTLGVEVKEPFEKRKNSKALVETLSLSEEFIDSELERINTVKKLKVSEMIDKTGLGNSNDLCEIFYKKKDKVDMKSEVGNEKVKPKSLEDIFKERVKSIYKRLEESYSEGLTEIKNAFEEGRWNLEAQKVEIGLGEESWDEIMPRIVRYRTEYRMALSKTSKERIEYMNGDTAIISNNLEEIERNIVGLTNRRMNELPPNIEEKRLYCDEFSGVKTSGSKKKADEPEESKKRGTSDSDLIEKFSNNGVEMFDGLPFNELYLKFKSIKKDCRFSPTHVFLTILMEIYRLKLQSFPERIIDSFLLVEKGSTPSFKSKSTYKTFDGLAHKLNFYELNYISKSLNIKNYINDDGELEFEGFAEDPECEKIDMTEMEKRRKEEIMEYMGVVKNRGVIELIREENEMYNKRGKKKTRGGRTNKGRGKSGGRGKGEFKYAKLSKYNKFKSSNEISCFTLALNLVCLGKKFSKNEVYILEKQHLTVTPCCNHLVKRYTYFLNKVIKKAKRDRVTYKQDVEIRKDERNDFFKQEKLKMINRIKEVIKEI